jgi:hypothetical protein
VAKSKRLDADGTACVESSVRRFLDLSTAHVPQKTVPWLDKQTTKMEYGWWVTTAYTQEEDCPTEVRHILELAAKHNCAYVLLDRDAEKIKGLPVFDW